MSLLNAHVRTFVSHGLRPVYLARYTKPIASCYQFWHVTNARLTVISLPRQKAKSGARLNFFLKRVIADA